MNILEKESQYELLGEGECRQDNNENGLEYRIEFGELTPHNASNNADRAKKRCLRLCTKYSWCYAAQVTLTSYLPTPECSLVTDHPTFEHAYGLGQDYDWGKRKTIDGDSYQTYDGGYRWSYYPEVNYVSNWGGGSLYPRDGYYCYRKMDLGKGINQLL